MHKGITLLLFILCAGLISSAQNLVPNPSFEDISACPNKFLLANELNKYCPPWIAPTVGSPDIFNICNTNTFYSIPYYIMELFDSRSMPRYCTAYQSPRTGNCFLRALFNVKISKIPECFQIKLLKDLEKGKKYYVGFYINMGNCSANALKDIGIYLSKDSLRNYANPNYDPPPYGLPEVTPQLLNKTGFLKDTVNWIEISDIYKAEGGEKWLTISSFNNDIYDSLADDQRAEYYFDDIFVYEIEGIIAEDSICKGNSSFLSTNAKGSFYWSSNDNGTDTLSTDSLFLVKPVLTTTYHLISSAFKDSHTLHVTSSPLPDIYLPTDTIKCKEKSITLDAGAGHKSYLWSSGENTQTITANKPGHFIVTVQNDFGCKNTDTVQVTNYPYPKPIIENDTTVCFEETNITLNATTSPRYFWQPFGETSQVITATVPNTYIVQVSDTNNCTYTDSIVLTNLCEHPAWFPNAFTPGNNDTLNNIFRPLISNVYKYYMTIYSLWGVKLFETEDYAIGWNGIFKNQPCPTGWYVYAIQYTTLINGKMQSRNKSGVVFLVR